MKRLINHIPALLLVASCLAISSCKDDEGILVNKISVMQTTFGPQEKILYIDIKDNQTLELVTLIFPADAANKEVTYETMNPSVVEVSSTGVLTGKSPGTDMLTIRAKDGSGTVQNYKILVKDHKIKATHIEFAAADKNISIDTDGTVDLASKVVFTPADVWEKTLTYQSSDPAVASVDAKGVVTGVKAGTSTITVTTADGSNKSTQTFITVKPDLYRANWAMTLTWSSTASPDFPNVIDGNLTTFMNIPKPIRHAAGPPDGVPFGFIIDLRAPKTINYFRLMHRNDQLGLRLRKLSLFGSNDNITYNPITPQGISIQYEPQSFITIDDQMITESTYRYIKIICDDWDKNANSVIQITEFYLGRK